jgi:hypothetical protein
VTADPCAKRVGEDLAEPDLVAGVAAGCWRILRNAFPILDFVITATEPNGDKSEYGFRAELSNYPAQAPMVRIWDHASNGPLAPNKRPKGGPRVQKSFQHWTSDTVYRPWDRVTGPHVGAANTPHLAWRPERHLLFIFEDLHGLLNSNARAIILRKSA